MVYTFTYAYKQTQRILKWKYIMKIPIAAGWRSHAVDLMWSGWEIVKQAISYRAEQSLHADMINWLRHPSQDNLFFRHNHILRSIWTDTTSQQLQNPTEFMFTLVKCLSVFWLSPLPPKHQENINLFKTNNITSTLKYFREIHSLRYPR